ncbi:phage virion morphogenesis protein [Methylobacterium sp. WL6]|uniref:phage virion morphogenesis protein n=1 Tax=Methylobacterium sp. WL6 TaxID=2603901 RepID=UPI0011CA1727|nr:phage virion morphogenesis protein [Methylobacterium sp. WL6]TXN60894.1 phage virion morphogenesis protein [Methylobacterium sp. WL6]
MSGASIKIVVSDAEIAAGLKRLVDTGRDLRPAMDAIGGALLTSTQQRFERKAGPDGGAWAPFAPSTLKRMPDRRKPPELLRDRGRLYSSLTFAAGDDSVEVGTNVVYAAIHQFGGDIVMPERQGSATFVTVRQGAGVTKDGKRVGSRLRFAKASTRAKSKETKAFTVPAHTIRIPARPYLGISDADKAEILAILADELGEAGAAEVTP